MYKKRVILLALAVIFLFCGCSRAVCNYADELKSSVWLSEFKNNTSVRLSFSDYNCKLEISTNETKDTKRINAEITGLCVVDNENFAVTDEKTGQTFKFNYKLKGKTCDIIYNGAILTLNREDEG